MFAAGIALPMLLGSLSLPPALWDFMQIGGLAGMIVFGGIYLATKPKAKPADKA